MGIRYYLNVAWKRAWIVLLLTAIAVASSYFFSRNQPVQFKTTTTLLINPASPNELIPYLSSLQVDSAKGVKTLAATYTEYLKSRAFTSLVIDQLKLDAAPEELAGALSTELVPDTNFFRIHILWHDPHEARRLADGIASIFITENERLQAERLAKTTPAAAKLDGWLAYYEPKIAALRAQRDTLTARGAAGDTVAVIDNELQRMESLYLQTIAVATTARGTNSTSVNTATIVDPAVPAAYVGTSTARNVGFAGGFAAALGIGLIVLLEYLDSTLKTPKDIEALTGAAPLGVIGLISERHAREGEGLVALRYPHTQVTETFRALRTNIQFSTLNKTLKTLLITSAGAGEGKSVLSSNLAITLAQAGRRVLLIDADLRRPTLHTIFGVPMAKGVADMLLLGWAFKRWSLAELLEHQLFKTTGVSNLFLLTAGQLPPNAAELLASDQMARLLEQLAQKVDFVVIDAPAAGAYTDAIALGTRVDGVLVAARSGKTAPLALNKVLTDLDKVNAPRLGTVLTQVNLAELGGPSFYTYAPRVEPSAILPGLTPETSPEAS